MEASIAQYLFTVNSEAIAIGRPRFEQWVVNGVRNLYDDTKLPVRTMVAKNLQSAAVTYRPRQSLKYDY